MSYHFDSARAALESFILGATVPYIVVPDSQAPQSLGDLIRWTGHGNLPGIDPLPVSGDFCEHTIWSRRSINYAFRAWHDALHIRHNLGFDFDSEIQVARIHQSKLTGQLGVFERDAKRLLWADTAGQSLYFERWGEFPVNQRHFAEAFLVNESLALSVRW